MPSSTWKVAAGLAAFWFTLGAGAQQVQENAAKPGNSGDWKSGNPANQQPEPRVKDDRTATTAEDAMSQQAGASGTAGQSASGSAAAGAKMAVNRSDQQAIIDMAMANMTEVELGKVAQAKSANAEVKQFAQQMIDDHGKALADVQQLAQSKGVTLPGSLDSMHNAELAKMQGMSGAAFDKAYLAKAGVADHKKVHSQLMLIQKRAKDPDVKALAAKMLPVVEQHLNAAEKMSPGKAKMPPDVGSATEHVQGKPTH